MKKVTIVTLSDFKGILPPDDISPITSWYKNQKNKISEEYSQKIDTAYLECRKKLKALDKMYDKKLRGLLNAKNT